MRVLVAVGSKHGATAEIGETIGEVLVQHGLEVTISSIDDAGPVEGYDAAILGSAVYAGHWTKPARRYVEANQHALSQIPVWLFSSGPVGDPPAPDEDPVDAAGIVEHTDANDHHVFSGKLDTNELGFAERAMVRAFKAPEGDFRDWDDIRSWAKGIAVNLDPD